MISICHSVSGSTRTCTVHVYVYRYRSCVPSKVRKYTYFRKYLRRSSNEDSVILPEVLLYLRTKVLPYERRSDTSVPSKVSCARELRRRQMFRNAESVLQTTNLCAGHSAPQVYKTRRTDLLHCLVDVLFGAPDAAAARASLTVLARRGS